MRYFIINLEQEWQIAESEVIPNPGRTQLQSYRQRRKRRNRECEWILDSLKLEESVREQAAFWIKRSRCICDPGKRKYKTHNRLQRIFKNPRQLAEVYDAVRDLLESEI
ncbi:MAG: hypothetical protein K2H82_05440 [Oscillospiraceae bacterium]|nr:hypothetical protein [Oscillospiraceae bacterium]